MVVPTLVYSSFLLGVPCLFTKQVDTFLFSGITCLTSILYWTGAIHVNIDKCVARVCMVLYCYKNTKCIKYRTHGFVTAGIFSIFYILSCLTNLIFLHALFHFFVMCAKLFVVFDPMYYHGTCDKPKNIRDKLGS